MTFKTTFVLALAASATALARPVYAQSGIYVEYYTSGDACLCNPSSFGDGWVPVPGFADRRGGCPCAGSPQAGLSNGSNVSFSGNSGTTYRVFNATGGSIGNISVSGSGFTLLVGRSSSTFPPFTNATVNLGAPGGSSVGTVTANGATVQVYSSGSVGAVSADSVVRVDATNSTSSVSSFSTIGTVRAPSVGNVTAATGITGVVVANWDFGPAPSDYTATASTTSGSIGSVAVTSARMRGTVQASAGSIGTVSSNVGIGPSSGGAITIRARDGITTVSAPTINANIDAKFSGGTGIVQTVNSSSSSGTFTGSLSAAGIGSSGTGLTVSGTMPASVTITGPVQKNITVTGSASGAVSVSGAVSQPVSFNGGYSASTLSLGALSSTLSITGNMTAATTVASTSSAAAINVSGTLPSTNALTITGTHAGAIDFNGVVSGLIKVGDASTGTMTFGTSGVPGLNGQVVVNSANGSNNWTGNVLLQGGSVTVTPSSNVYDNPASTFGTDTNGGAVGRGTYRHHGADSRPKQGGIATNWFSSPPSLAAFDAQSPRTKKSDWFSNADEIQARFYGPLTVSTASGFSLPDPRAAGVTIWFCPFDTFSTSSMTDVSTLFEVALPSLTFNRDLQVRPICGVDYRNTSGEMRGVYRVVKNDAASGGIYTSQLRSQYTGTTGGEPTVDEFAHYFRFFCSPADVGDSGGSTNSDGGLDNGDYIAFITLYFASDPRADLGKAGGEPGSDGLFDNNDFIAHVNFFFAGCDASTISCFAGRGGNREIPSPDPIQPSADQIARQIEVLWSIYEATQDPRILERINALGGGR